MTGICDLPHELIAAIGGHLLPKWRLRLFICRKEWSRECIRPQRWLFKWNSNLALVHANIDKIYYKVIKMDTDEVISRRISTLNETYSIYSQHNDRYSTNNSSMIICTKNMVHYYNSYVDDPCYYAYRSDEGMFNAIKEYFIQITLREKNVSVDKMFTAMENSGAYMDKYLFASTLIPHKIKKIIARVIRQN
jgi:hypothetical protein